VNGGGVEDAIFGGDDDLQVAAIAFSLLGSRAAAKGYPISTADCQIAAIAAVHGFTVATRDTAPFIAAGVPVINSWEY
jgi:predicted nucleic acid-binding protein